MYVDDPKSKLNTNNYTAILLEQSHDNSVSYRATIDGKYNDILQHIVTSNFVVKTVGVSPLEELQLKYRDDDVKDINEIREILSRKLSYPSTQIAQIHRKANRLGPNDIKNAHKKHISFDDNKICSCCGFMAQQQLLTYKTSLEQVTHIGVSTYLYFNTIKNLVVLMIIMTLMYSIFAMITNAKVSSIYENNFSKMQISQQNKTYQSYLRLTLGSKLLFLNQYSQQTFAIQWWIGVSMILMWGIIFIVAKHNEIWAEHNIDNQTKTAGDYNLFFKKMPRDMTAEKLQQLLKDYQNQMRSRYNGYLINKDIKVVKINQAIPFYLNKQSFEDEELSQVLKQLETIKDQFSDMILSRKTNNKFKVDQKKKMKLFTRFQQLKLKKKQIYREIADLITDYMIKQCHRSYSTPAIVTFADSHNKLFLEKMHKKSLLRQLLNKTCFSDDKLYFGYEIDGKQTKAGIEAAPEPEDILWTNLGQGYFEIFRKKIVTNSIALVLLCICFIMVYCLENFQERYKLKQTSKILSILVSLSISITISIFNVIIGKILIYMTKFQRNFTYTQQQTGVAVKTVFAISINSILLPIMVHKFIKNNLYGEDGLSDAIFFYAMTNCLLMPLMKIANPNYFFKDIHRKYYYTPQKKLRMNQRQLNTAYQEPQFCIGYEYSYIISQFLFVCFYVSLVPTISIFGIIQFFAMYWAQKYCVYHQCKRPSQGNSYLNDIMSYFIYFGPTMYTFGCFCWSSIFQKSHNQELPNLVAAIISIVIFIFPYTAFVEKIMKQEQFKNQRFQDDRIFLSSEYDRLNPVSSKQGVKDFINYVKQYKIKLMSMKNSQLETVYQTFIKQNGLGHGVSRDPFGNQTNTQGQLINQQLLGGTDANSINPLILGTILLPLIYSKIPLGIVSQNWVKNQQQSLLQKPENRENPLLSLIQNIPTNQAQGQALETGYSEEEPDPINHQIPQSELLSQERKQVQIDLFPSFFGVLLSSQLRENQRK